MPICRRAFSVCTLLLVVATCGNAAAQEAVPFSSQRTLSHVVYLASDELHGRGAGTGDERLAAEYIARQLDAYGVSSPPHQGRFQDFSFRRGAESVASRSVNVLGWIEGTDQKLRDEVIVVGAHFDHLGVVGGSVRPGADDNASGVAALLEMAAALSAHRERLGRSVAVVFFSGEEIGLLGSYAFVRNCPLDIERIAAMMNIDMIGRPLMDQPTWDPLKKLIGIDSKNTVAVLGLHTRPLFSKSVIAAADPLGIRVIGTQRIPVVWSVVESLAKNRSDHTPFESIGIPTLFFCSGESSDYHRSGDTADKIDGEMLARRAQLMYESLVALTKSPGQEFPAIQNARLPPGDVVPTLTLQNNSLSALLKDNAESPRKLSGLDSLFHTRDAPEFDAFDPDEPGASAGLNFEHITGGRANPHNKFAPRQGTYRLVRQDEKSATLVRRREDCPWDVSSTLRYELVEPNAIDFEFRCTPHDRDRFGERGYATFFFANYMNDVADPALHFLGIDAAGGKEQWIVADAPAGNADWNHGGTYRAVQAAPSAYDPNHDFRLNLWTYDYPRFTRPFYYGRAAHDMVFLLMFDRAHSEVDEIRFSLFKFKLPKKPRPAWDFQYVIHQVDANRQYGFRGRLVWKKWISQEDCVAEYERFAATKTLPKSASQDSP